MGKKCFIAGTKISTPNGAVNIEDLKVGDEIYCFDENHKLMGSYVVRVYHHEKNDPESKILKIVFEGGEIGVTDNHWLLDTEDQFKCADLFKVGDYLINEEQKPVKIISIEELSDQALYTLSVAVNPNFIANGIIAHNKGKGKSSEEVKIQYKATFAIAEVICFEKPLIKFEARLGNVLCILDGTTTEYYIPSYWMKKYFHTQGYGYIKMFPTRIRLYRDSLENELLEGVDFDYDFEKGKVTLYHATPAGSIIAGTWTYDEANSKDTTFYADFAYNELFHRLGIKYYKYQDDGLNTYLKCCLMAKNLLNEFYKPIIAGQYDIVYNPQVEIGQSIYIRHILPDVKRVFFIENVRETHTKKTHQVDIGGLNFPEPLAGIGGLSWGRFVLHIPEDMVTFLGSDYNVDGLYLAGEIRKLTNPKEVETGYGSDLRMTMSKRDESKNFPNSDLFVPNTRYMKSFNGYFCQYWDISFSQSFIANYTEFADADVFFAKRLTNFIVMSSSDSYESKADTQNIFVGRKELVNKGINPGTYANNDHMIFLDVDGDLWMGDYRFATKKIGSVESAILSATNIEIVSGFGHIFMVVDGAVSKFNEDTATWTPLGSITNYTNKMYSRSGFYTDIEGNMYFQATGYNGAVGGGNYRSLLYVTSYKQGVISQVNVHDGTYAYPQDGNPFISLDGYVWYGYWGFDLLNHTHDISLGDLFWTEKPSVYYCGDGSNQFMGACVAYNQTGGFNQVVGIAKKWSFHHRSIGRYQNFSRDGWIEFDSTMKIIPLGIVDNGAMVVYMEGADLATYLHPQTESAIALIYFDEQEIKLKLFKTGADAQDFLHNFYLNGALYLDWKKYNFSELPTLATIPLEE